MMWHDLFVLALDLMKKLLAFHPDDRLTVQQALEHPYLKGIVALDDKAISE